MDEHQKKRRERVNQKPTLSPSTSFPKSPLPPSLFGFNCKKTPNGWKSPVAGGWDEKKRNGGLRGGDENARWDAGPHRTWLRQLFFIYIEQHEIYRCISPPPLSPINVLWYNNMRSHVFLICLTPFLTFPSLGTFSLPSHPCAAGSALSPLTLWIFYASSAFLRPADPCFFSRLFLGFSPGSSRLRIFKLSRPSSLAAAGFWHNGSTTQTKYPPPGPFTLNFSSNYYCSVKVKVFE